MRPFLQSLRFLLPRNSATETSIRNINGLRAAWADLSDEELREKCHAAASSLEEVIAATVVVAKRVLLLDMYDVQLHGALALAQGRIAEMQTGEGKTLAAVPAIVWYAEATAGRPCHDCKRLSGAT